MKRSAYFALPLLAIFASTACNKGGDNGSPDDENATKCQHKFTDEVVEALPTCLNEGLINYKCTDCGEIVDTEVLDKKMHRLSVLRDECTEYSCVKEGVIVHICSECNTKMTTTLGGDHLSLGELPSYATFKEKDGESATFYKTCTACGETVSETFTEPVYKKTLYAPVSPTVTLYETDGSLAYGFRWNMAIKPLVPMIAIKRSTDSEWTRIPAVNDIYADQTYYCKAEAALIPGVCYQYKFIDYAADAESDTYSFTAVDPAAESFTFAALGDSQNSTEDGKYLARIFGAVGDVDFLVHLGDFCEDTRIEQNWTNMLDANKDYFATTPVMPIAGNHDTTYKAGTDTVTKHFNNNIPEQSSTAKGYYYSFTYSNAKFIMINTNIRSHWGAGDPLPEEQYNWIVEELRSNTSRWTVVVMHCPLYSPGGYGSQTSNNQNAASVALRAQLNDIFVEYGVDLVIQAHDHLACKTYPIGEGGEKLPCTQTELSGITYDVSPEAPIYLMIGPAGNQTRAPVSGYASELYEYAEPGKEASWAEYTVTADSMTYTVKYVDESGTVGTYYTYGILKPAE